MNRLKDIHPAAHHLSDEYLEELDELTLEETEETTAQLLHLFHVHDVLLKNNLIPQSDEYVESNPSSMRDLRNLFDNPEKLPLYDLFRLYHSKLDVASQILHRFSLYPGTIDNITLGEDEEKTTRVSRIADLKKLFFKPIDFARNALSKARLVDINTADALNLHYASELYLKGYSVVTNFNKKEFADAHPLTHQMLCKAISYYGIDLHDKTNTEHFFTPLKNIGNSLADIVDKLDEQRFENLFVENNLNKTNPHASTFRIKQSFIDLILDSNIDDIHEHPLSQVSVNYSYVQLAVKKLLAFDDEQLLGALHLLRKHPFKERMAEYYFTMLNLVEDHGSRIFAAINNYEHEASFNSNPYTFPETILHFGKRIMAVKNKSSSIENALFSAKYRLDNALVYDYIGSGSQGVVLLAHNKDGSGRRAVKTSHATDANHAEIGSLEKLRDNNIENVLTIYNYGDILWYFDRKVQAIEMEYVDGKTITELFDEELTEQQKAIIIAQVVRGIHDCNKIGIYHHDIRPDNIKVTDDLFVKILDFGVSDDNPEQPKQYNIRHGNDLFSVGVMYDTFHLGYPFGDRSKYQNTMLFKEDVKKNKERITNIPEWVKSRYTPDSGIENWNQVGNVLIALYEEKSYMQIKKSLYGVEKQTRDVFVPTHLKYGRFK